MAYLLGLGYLYLAYNQHYALSFVIFGYSVRVWGTSNFGIAEALQLPTTELYYIFYNEVKNGLLRQ